MAITNSPENDPDLPNRAVRQAIDALGRNYDPLSRLQCIVIACIAAHKAMPALDPELSPAMREGKLAADVLEGLVQEIRAVRVSGIPRSDLVGGIDRLPERQRLILALLHQADMKHPEICAVLNITPQELKAELALAMDALWDGAP